MRILGRNATTLPGRISLIICSRLPEYLTSGRNVTLITGTNGKTTAVRILSFIYRENGFRVVSNVSGANLMAGITTSLIEASSFKHIRKKRKNGNNNEDNVRIVLEVDEAVFGKYADVLNPGVVVITNLFEDQVDRYKNIHETRRILESGLKKTFGAYRVLCADDPHVASLGRQNREKSIFFGEQEKTQDVKVGYPDYSESNISCVFCGSDYIYSSRKFGHMGKYKCKKCLFSVPDTDISAEYLHKKDNLYEVKFVRNENGTESESFQVDFPIPGEHNIYNALAAVAASVANGISLEACKIGILKSTAGFGRTERFKIKNKEVSIMLVKNAAGLEQALNFLEKATDVGAAFFLLNDNIADGTDISWIHNVNFRYGNLPDNVYVSGIRFADLVNRIEESAGIKTNIKSSADFRSMFEQALDKCQPGECLYVFPNYTSLLSLRSYLKKKFKLNEIWR